MFYKSEIPHTHTQRPRMTFGERLRDLGQLAVDFLTLEDGHEPDWASQADDDLATRPPACEGRVRQPRQAFVGSPWINA